MQAPPLSDSTNHHRAAALLNALVCSLETRVSVGYTARSKERVLERRRQIQEGNKKRKPGV